MKAQMGSRSIPLPIHNLSGGMVWLVNTTLQPFYSLERHPVPVVHDAGWSLQPVWTGIESLASTRIRTPDCPACSRCLVFGRYPVQISVETPAIITDVFLVFSSPSRQALRCGHFLPHPFSSSFTNHPITLRYYLYSNK